MAISAEDMWTFALRHAVNFHSSSARKDKSITPHEAFTGESPPWAITSVLGCLGPQPMCSKKSCRMEILMAIGNPGHGLGFTLAAQHAIPAPYH
jgi:hypothetical protein